MPIRAINISRSAPGAGAQPIMRQWAGVVTVAPAVNPALVTSSVMGQAQVPRPAGLSADFDDIQQAINACAASRGAMITAGGYRSLPYLILLEPGFYEGNFVTGDLPVHIAASASGSVIVSAAAGAVFTAGGPAMTQTVDYFGLEGLIIVGNSTEDNGPAIVRVNAEPAFPIVQVVLRDLTIINQSGFAANRCAVIGGARRVDIEGVQALDSAYQAATGGGAGGISIYKTPIAEFDNAGNYSLLTVRDSQISPFSLSQDGPGTLAASVEANRRAIIRDSLINTKSDDQANGEWGFGGDFGVVQILNCAGAFLRADPIGAGAVTGIEINNSAFGATFDSVGLPTSIPGSLVSLTYGQAARVGLISDYGVVNQIWAASAAEWNAVLTPRPIGQLIYVTDNRTGLSPIRAGTVPGPGPGGAGLMQWSGMDWFAPDNY
ncbi:MAG: hypothetical protein KCHDKBKB_03120 [Elusimicrobia bacterium]|nr:hypothetical protein [Elusimicrobiota bacterium]